MHAVKNDTQVYYFFLMVRSIGKLNKVLFPRTYYLSVIIYRPEDLRLDPFRIRLAKSGFPMVQTIGKLNKMVAILFVLLENQTSKRSFPMFLLSPHSTGDKYGVVS